MPTAAVTPCIWSDHRAEEQARYYCGLFPNSRVISVSHVDDHLATVNGANPGDPLLVTVELAGQLFTVLNGVSSRPFTEAVSFQIFCEDQAEVDHYWDAFSDGGKPNVCGWIADRYGLQWQIVPQVFMDVMSGDDEKAKARVMAAMLNMTKFDVAAIAAAAR